MKLRDCKSGLLRDCKSGLLRRMQEEVLNQPSSKLEEKLEKLKWCHLPSINVQYINMIDDKKDEI